MASRGIFFAILAYNLFFAAAQTNDFSNTGEISKRGDCRIMFYNVENLFDCKDDPRKNDNEFLPESKRYWTEQRFRQKLNNIFKVIAAAGESQPPEIIGFAEIENRYVLEQLVNNTPLSKYPYSIVHFDSPDERGIDVALIYRPDKVKKISEKIIRIKYSPTGNRATRDILYLSFKVGKKDTLHLFVNHWPSRYGGQIASEKYRIFVANFLRARTDSLFARNINAKIILMGDFNDEPHNKSIRETLKAEKVESTILPGRLYNLSDDHKNPHVQGSHKYQGNWALLDQAMVSGSLMIKSGVYVPPGSFTIFSAPFLLEADKKYLGTKPRRTYTGFSYNGGFSDHLPVYIDLYVGK
ncbi:MAG: endonuclease [Bacteroidales bacterium]|nr:endonuclease [Bacteroidales bacterium]